MPYQIMYSSRATAPMTVAGLEEILEDARAGNEARDITGALVYCDGIFFQILEGEKDAAQALMASIENDTRHTAVTVFQEGEVDARAFGSWRMAYLSTTAAQMSAWAGLPSTTTVEELLADVTRNAHRVPQILVNVLKALSR